MNKSLPHEGESTPASKNYLSSRDEKWPIDVSHFSNKDSDRKTPAALFSGSKLGSMFLPAGRGSFTSPISDSLHVSSSSSLASESNIAAKIVK